MTSMIKRWLCDNSISVENGFGRQGNESLPLYSIFHLSLFTEDEINSEGFATCPDSQFQMPLHAAQCKWNGCEKWVCHIPSHISSTKLTNLLVSFRMHTA